jgi:hypothetical protein
LPGADFPPGTRGHTVPAALFSFLAHLPESLLSKSVLMALEADFATAKREAVALVEQGLSPSHYGTYELLMTTLRELLGESDVTVVRRVQGVIRAFGSNMQIRFLRKGDL